MFAALIEEIFASYRSPRAAVRRVIDRVGGWNDVALLFGVAFCLSSSAAVAVALLLDGGAGAEFGSLAASLVFSVVVYVVVTAIIFRVGRLFGGTGEALDIAAAVAWHSVATAPLAPVVALASYAGQDGGAIAALAVAQIGVALVAVWLLAHFVAEAHRFASALRVGFALVAGAISVGLVFSAIIAGLSS